VKTIQLFISTTQLVKQSMQIAIESNLIVLSICCAVDIHEYYSERMGLIRLKKIIQNLSKRDFTKFFPLIFLHTCQYKHFTGYGFFLTVL
jgi:hypothetical protein